MNGASGARYGEFREVSLVEIVVLIVVILVEKKSEKVFHSCWFSSSQSSEWRSSSEISEIFHLFAAEEVLLSCCR